MSLRHNILRWALPGKSPEGLAIWLQRPLAAAELRLVSHRENGPRPPFAVPENLEAQFAEAVIKATERHVTNIAAAAALISILYFPYSC
jgi:hypothetical protein